MALSDEEREHIRLAEEYRAELRTKLAPVKGESWLDKLAVPLLIVVVSGLLVPWILGRVEESRRVFDLQSRLIEKIVTDDAQIMTDARNYRGRISENKIELLEIEFEKRLLQLRSLDPKEREARRQELSQDLSRIRATYDQAHLAALDAMNRYTADEYKNREWIKLHYDNAPLQPYIEAGLEDRVETGRETTKFDEELTAIYKDAMTRLQTCPDESTCQAIYDKGRKDIDGHGFGPANYSRWDDARRKLTQFISVTKPRL
jgi:hypothetical protein